MQPATSEPGHSTSPTSQMHQEPTQPTKGTGKAAKAKPTPQPGGWINWDYNAALTCSALGKAGGTQAGAASVYATAQPRPSKRHNSVQQQQPDAQKSMPPIELSSAYKQSMSVTPTLGYRQDATLGGGVEKYSIMSEAKLLRENNDRDLVESCSKRRGVAESFTQLETRPRSVITSDCEVEEEDCEIEEEDCGDDMPIGQFNLLPPIDIETARLAAARINGEDAEEDAVLRAFIKAPKFADLATRSKAAASTQAKDKSQLKTSYQMFEDVLDNGTYADGEVASEEVMAALRLFLRKRPVTIEERCSHLYECYMKNPKVLCMVLCTLATGYRKSKDGGKCNADSLRQRISSLARTVRGEHHRVKISENDMAPILQPDDLMDFKGRFALMWKVVDGHDKAAFKAGEVTHTRKRAAIITEEDLVKALPHMDPATPQGCMNRVLYVLATGAFMRGDELVNLELHHLERMPPDEENEEEVYKIKDIACKNWQGGIKEAGRDPPNKKIQATPALPAGLGVFEKAKLCPVAAIDVLLSKHPKESPSQRLFLKPLPSVVAESEVWYSNAHVGISTLRLNFKTMFPKTTLHGGKRSAATAALSAGAPLPLVQKAGGWKTVESVTPYLAADKSARQKLSNAINAPLVAAAMRSMPHLSAPLLSIDEDSVPTASNPHPVTECVSSAAARPRCGPPPKPSGQPATPMSDKGGWQAYATAHGWRPAAPNSTDATPNGGPPPTPGPGSWPMSGHAAAAPAAYGGPLPTPGPGSWAMSGHAAAAPAAYGGPPPTPGPGSWPVSGHAAAAPAAYGGPPPTPGPGSWPMSGHAAAAPAAYGGPPPTPGPGSWPMSGHAAAAPAAYGGPPPTPGPGSWPMSGHAAAAPAAYGGPPPTPGPGSWPMSGHAAAAPAAYGGPLPTPGPGSWPMSGHAAAAPAAYGGPPPTPGPGSWPMSGHAAAAPAAYGGPPPTPGPGSWPVSGHAAAAPAAYGGPPPTPGPGSWPMSGHAAAAPAAYGGPPPTPGPGSWPMSGHAAAAPAAYGGPPPTPGPGSWPMSGHAAAAPAAYGGPPPTPGPGSWPVSGHAAAAPAAYGGPPPTPGPGSWPGVWYPGHTASWGPAPSTWQSAWHPAAHAAGAIDPGIAQGFEEFRASEAASKAAKMKLLAALIG
ncbi:hypothetical protein QJQ45_006978 [Haematococcus lacustris]|nr:hypothetical protein QJQ45_006978 [Haematococcus lacustris]